LHLWKRHCLHALLGAVLLGVLPVGMSHAADMRPGNVFRDDDDDDETEDVKPAATGSAQLPPPGRADTLAAVVFEPLAARNWSAELGVRQRFSSRQGRRRSIEGATGLIFDLQWRDTLFLSSDRGIGANLLHLRGALVDRDQFAAGVSLSFDERGSNERSQAQSRSLDAKRGSAVFALGFAEYKVARWRLWTELAHFLGPDKGNVLSLGVDYRLPLTEKWSTTLATGLSLADGRYMRDNYAAPAILTYLKRPLFIQPKAGLRDVTVSMDFEYAADRYWRWNTQVGFTNSLVIAQKGAWVKVRSEPFISTGVKYRF
jgi:outer membrane scaffolding protein for murein synthesis (MipA/OmpV family)